MSDENRPAEIPPIRAAVFEHARRLQQAREDEERRKNEKRQRDEMVVTAAATPVYNELLPLKGLRITAHASSGALDVELSIGGYAGRTFTLYGGPAALIRIYARKRAEIGNLIIVTWLSHPGLWFVDINSICDVPISKTSLSAAQVRSYVTAVIGACLDLNVMQPPPVPPPPALPTANRQQRVVDISETPDHGTTEEGR